MISFDSFAMKDEKNCINHYNPIFWLKDFWPK